MKKAPDFANSRSEGCDILSLDINSVCRSCGRCCAWEKVRREKHKPHISGKVNTEVVAESLAGKIEKQRSDVDSLAAPQEGKVMLELCDQIRWRMLSVAMGAYPKSLIGSCTLPQDSTVVEPGGVIHTVYGNSIIICLPNIENLYSQDCVTADLVNLFENRQRVGLNWILDFSSVTCTPPLLLMGVLGGYRHDLSEYRAHLLITWLRLTLFSKPYQELLESQFDLQQVGGYLFSKGVE